MSKRMEALKAAGFDTDKMFSITLAKGLKPGSTITILLDEETDEIAAQIKEDGYLENKKLFRRWVMAQMFRMLGYTSKRGDNGYNGYLKQKYSYKYQFEMMLDELKVLAILQKEDPAEFEFRTQFFNKNVVYKICNEHIKLMDRVFRYDQDKTSRQRVRIERLRRTDNYSKVLENYKDFYADLGSTYKDWSKIKAWKDAFKGAGSAYTLLNLVRFHDCAIHNGDAELKGEEAVAYITDKCREYNGQWYKLFALLKETIRNNDFDFKARMAEIYDLN